MCISRVINVNFYQILVHVTVIFRNLIFVCITIKDKFIKHLYNTGWLGWAMVLGSFQCRGVRLLLHIVGQGPAMLAAGAGRVSYNFHIFHLSSLSNVLSFGRLQNMTEILWF